MADEERYLETDPEDAKIQQARRGGVKLNREKSKFAQQAKSREEFEQRADDVHNQINERRQRTLDAVQQFWNAVKDKTLASNKGPIQKNLEKEMFAKLLSIATEMNTDINLNESEGSVALITLLMKAVLYQRDLVNELEYKLAQQERLNKLSRADNATSNAK